MWAQGLTKAESGMQSLTATVQRRAAHVVKPKLLLGCEPTFHLRQGHPLHVHMSACRAHVFVQHGSHTERDGVQEIWPMENKFMCNTI